MSEDVVERNEEFLQKLKDGEIEDSKIPNGCGSFFRLVFRQEEFDAIPLFFDYLSYKTGRDYSAEVEWVQECMEKASEEYDKLMSMIGDDPLLKMLLLCKMMSE